MEGLREGGKKGGREDLSSLTTTANSMWMNSPA